MCGLHLLVCLAIQTPNAYQNAASADWTFTTLGAALLYWQKRGTMHMRIYPKEQSFLTDPFPFHFSSFFLWHSHWCAPVRAPHFYSSPNLSSTVKFALVQLGGSSWSHSIPDFLYCHIACSVLCSYGSHLGFTSIALGFHFVVLYLWFCLYKTKGKLLMLSKIDCVAWGVQFSFRVLKN